MRATVRNFRGVTSATIAVDRLALIASRNANGKSSLLQAIAAVATGDALGPYRGEVPQKDAGQLVHEGDRQASAELVGDTGVALMEWPKCQLITKGEKPPHASAFAVGAISVATLPAKERAAALEPYLKTLPTKDDLIEALGGEVDEASLETVWGMLEAEGWDIAHKRWCDKRAELGGKWDQVTGERHGRDKAVRWAPEGWRPGLDDTDEQELQQQVVAQRSRLDEVIADQAVVADQLQRLEALNAELPARIEAWQAANAAKTAAAKALENAQAAQRDLPRPPEEEKPVKCPHCDGLLLIRGDLAGIELQKYEKKSLPAAELKKMTAAITAAGKVVSAKNYEHVAAVTAYEKADIAWREANNAQLALADARKKGTRPEQVDIARQHLMIAENDLKIFRQMTSARQLAEQWETAQLVIDVLKPEGLRQKKLAAAIETFNQEQLAPVCEMAGWDPVEIVAEDLGVTYGGRRYLLLSESEQFRARVALQVAQAQMDGSQLLVIDRADVLDRAGRNDLFALLAEIEIPAVIAMTWINPLEALPDLSAEVDADGRALTPLGQTFWLEGGTAHSLLDFLERAAA